MCHNNSEKSSTTKANIYTACGYSLFTHCSFYISKNKCDHSRGRYTVNNFCKDLKEHSTKVTKEVKRRVEKGYSLFLKQEMCNDIIYNKLFNRTDRLGNEIDANDLDYMYRTLNRTNKFDDFSGPMTL